MTDTLIQLARAILPSDSWDSFSVATASLSLPLVVVGWIALVTAFIRWARSA